MSTVIKNPSVGRSSTGTVTGGVSGAARGYIVGSILGGPIGGLIVGGVLGALGGKNSDKSKQQGQLAYEWAKLRQERQGAVARRDIIRGYRAQRAVSLAMINSEEGGNRSSTPQGAVASGAAQFAFNLNFFDADVFMQRKIQYHANKAGKYAGRANEINATLSAITSTAIAAKSFFSPSPAPTSSGGSVGGGIPTSPVSTAPAPYSPGWSGTRYG